MTVRQLWVQDTDYNAVDDRLWIAAMLPPGPHLPVGSSVGLRTDSDLLLRMTTGLRGTVSTGVAYIPWAGSIYMLTSDAVTTLDFGPADPVNARIDLVVAEVSDREHGGDDTPKIRVVPGQPSQNPVRPNAPGMSIVLNSVRYNAGSTAPIVVREALILSQAGPQGLLTIARQQVVQDITSTIICIASTTLYGRRQMKVQGRYQATQISGQAGASHCVVQDSVSSTIVQLGGGIVANSGQLFYEGHAYTVAGPGPYSAHLNVATSPGAQRVTQAWVAIEDLGPA